MKKFNFLVNAITGMAIGASIFCISLDHRADAAVYVPRETLVAEAHTDEGRWIPLGKYKLTAYCNCKKCCGKWAGGPTASGTMPSEGRTVACGSLPFDTHIMIDGTEYVVEDRGVTGHHIDVYIDSHDRASDFGVKYAQVYRWVEE